MNNFFRVRSTHILYQERKKLGGIPGPPFDDDAVVLALRTNVVFAPERRPRRTAVENIIFLLLFGIDDCSSNPFGPVAVLLEWRQIVGASMLLSSLSSLAAGERDAPPLQSLASVGCFLTYIKY